MKKLFMSIIAVVLFAFSGYAFAMNEQSVSVSATSVASYSEEELVAMIAKLQKQLELVRANNVPCSLADVDLSLGDGEDSVSKIHTKNLQAFLKEKGYFKLEPTGYFGKVTQASLVAFQKANGLDATGQLNASVRSYIATLKCRKGAVANIKTEIKPEAKDVSTQASTVSAINLAGEANRVKWQTSGYAKEGYKIVWSMNPSPTYPTRDSDKYIFLADPNAYNTTLEAFAGTGTYYVRVCALVDGACRIYSNEIKLSL